MTTPPLDTTPNDSHDLQDKTALEGGTTVRHTSGVGHALEETLPSVASPRAHVPTRALAGDETTIGAIGPLPPADRKTPFVLRSGRGAMRAPRPVAGATTPASEDRYDTTNDAAGFEPATADSSSVLYPLS